MFEWPAELGPVKLREPRSTSHAAVVGTTPGAVLGDPTRTPADRKDREAALDVSGSWIVQAPAGAGKTELLTQRFLKLLTVVDEPEEILAITFTRAATGEMRGRIVSALEQAAHSRPAPGEPRALALARAALAHSKKRGWQLLEQPHRLDVQTIDSLCLRLAHGQPLLSRLGGQLSPIDDAGHLYQLAAERTFGRLGSAPAELDDALKHLLLLRDNHLADCVKLIAGMLERREQWRHVFVLSSQKSVDWDQVRAQLEAPFAAEAGRVLRGLHDILSAAPTLVDEMLALARYACTNGNPPPIALLDGLHALPAPESHFLEHWTCVRHFLLTQKGKWRRTFTVQQGFPVEASSPSEHGDHIPIARYKDRMRGLVEKLQRDERAGERLRTLLCQVTELPATRYDETQWQTLLSVFRILRQAVAELHVVFAERNQVDFSELSIAAATVLDEAENARGLIASESRRHLLVDEFQDTSRHQHQLIGRLLREWQPGDRRTCFLVGDPMQSIYIFRQAEVELFGRVQRRGLDCSAHTHRCAGLRLSENFRSHPGLVEPLNRYFETIFSSTQGGGRGIAFAPSTAAAASVEGLEALQIHPFFEVRSSVPDAHQAGTHEPAHQQQTRLDQVARVVALVEQELPRIRAAQAVQASSASSYTVAILGRAKDHLAAIAEALRARGIAFRAVELESLAERQEILDLLSLLRALLHPMDRIAWLSVLRAPWCGLSLGDLHTLMGGDDPVFRNAAVVDLMAERAHLLSRDGRERLARTAYVMTRATDDRGPSLATWVERAWTSLGAPAYLGPVERENAETFFRLLDELPPGGIDVFNGSLEMELARLCAAPDASVSEQFGVQLMTIHKAKGLGFDVVIVPGLERETRGLNAALVTMLERVRPGEGEEDEVLVAPLGGRGEQHRTYQWIQKQRSEREAGERMRLFYVACTRARRQLHLLGTAVVDAASQQIRQPGGNSLLACAWPALGPTFAAAWEARLRQPDQAAEVSSPVPVVDTESSSLLPGVPAEPGLIDRLAAATATVPGGPRELPGGPDALTLVRLPSGFRPELRLHNVTETGAFPRMGAPAGQERFSRPEGSFEQRARGNAVHTMLDFVSQVWAREGRSGPPSALGPQLQRLAHTELRRAGVAPARVGALAPVLAAIVVTAATHAEGRWILSPHRDARSEWSFSRWTSAGGAESRLNTQRADRVFRAGPAPLSEGSSCLWVVDYKTGAEPGGIGLEAWLEAQKAQWRPQLETYGNALREVFGETLQLRYGLYFPELLRLKSWSE